MAAVSATNIFRTDFNVEELDKDLQFLLNMEPMNGKGCKQNHATCIPIKSIQVFSANPLSKKSLSMAKSIFQIHSKTVELINAIKNYNHFYNETTPKDGNTNKACQEHLDAAHKNYLDSVRQTKLYAYPCPNFPKKFYELFYPPGASSAMGVKKEASEPAAKK